MAMVDVSGKAEIFREATATGTIKLRSETINLIENGKIAKGDSLYTAKIAGVLAAKRTSDLIPLCHPLPLTNVEVDVKVSDKSTVVATATVKTKAQTGVEMEALTAVSVATAQTAVETCPARESRPGTPNAPRPYRYSA